MILLCNLYINLMWEISNLLNFEGRQSPLASHYLGLISVSGFPFMFIINILFVFPWNFL